MKKYTKMMVIIVLMVLLFVKSDQLTVLQSLFMLLFLVAALYLFEKREVKRSFESGLRRLYICVDFEGVKRAINALKRNALFRPMTKEAVFTLERLLAFYTADKLQERTDLKDTYYRFWCGQVDFLSGITQLLEIEQSVYKQLSELDRERILVSKCYMKDSVEASEQLRSEVSSTLLIAELSLLSAKTSSEERLVKYYTKVAQNLAKGAFDTVSLGEDEKRIYLIQRTR